MIRAPTACSGGPRTGSDMPATVRVTNRTRGGLFAESVAHSLIGAKNTDTTRGYARATGKTFEALDHSISGGSSPRTWGTQQAAREDRLEQRFIPTHVGNTGGLSPLPPSAPVHPHARGEHQDAGTGLKIPLGSSPRTWGTRSWHLTRLTRYGSSPRTWGTRLARPAHRLPDRFIPTHVGNTSGATLTSTPTPVHPHARGEHGITCEHAPSLLGSSPRTWGTREVYESVKESYRFIPTHVGNTTTPCTSKLPRAVHPHARGEHVGAPIRVRHSCGSSPRTWGTLSGIANGSAVAGSSPRTWGTRALDPNFEGGGGSSPRTWGTRPLPARLFLCPRFIPTHVGNTVHRSLHRLSGRFIPTHVGNTSNINSPARSIAVHPHARGEHVTGLMNATLYHGSSPRTWGTLALDRLDPPVARFIPTHVGNTR